MKKGSTVKKALKMKTTPKMKTVSEIRMTPNMKTTSKLKMAPNEENLKNYDDLEKKKDWTCFKGNWAINKVSGTRCLKKM